MSTSPLGLRAAVNAMLPPVDLPEVVLEMFSRTGADKAFTSVTGCGARLADARDDRRAADRARLQRRLRLVIGGIDALKYNRLSHVDQTCLR